MPGNSLGGFPGWLRHGRLHVDHQTDYVVEIDAVLDEQVVDHVEAGRDAHRRRALVLGSFLHRERLAQRRRGLFVALAVSFRRCLMMLIEDAARLDPVASL